VEFGGEEGVHRSELDPSDAQASEVRCMSSRREDIAQEANSQEFSVG
jgi:hypothetical protein